MNLSLPCLCVALVGFFYSLPGASSGGVDKSHDKSDNVCLLQSSVSPKLTERNGPSAVSLATVAPHSQNQAEPNVFTESDATQAIETHGNRQAEPMALTESNTSQDSPIEESPNLFSNASSASLIEQAYNEIEFEVSASHGAAPHKSKLTLVLLEFFGVTGCLGIDRCYMGQTCLGVLKGMTFGGAIIWALIDYWVVVVNSLNKSTSIDSLGFVADFGTENTQACFVLGIIMVTMFALKALQSALSFGYKSDGNSQYSVGFSVGQ